MLSAIIATHESERALVPTLAALVPGATAGLLGEVIVADARLARRHRRSGRRRRLPLHGLERTVGRAAEGGGATTRTPWLMFLRAGCVPEPGWVDAADRFIEATDGWIGARAAVFRPPGIADLLRPGLGRTDRAAARHARRRRQARAGPADRAAALRRARRPSRRRRRGSRAAAPDRPAAARHAAEPGVATACRAAGIALSRLYAWVPALRTSGECRPILDLVK